MESQESAKNPVEKVLESLGQANHTLMEEVGARLGGFQPEAYQEFLKDFAQAVAKDAPRWQDLQSRYYENQAALWMNMLSRSAGQIPSVATRLYGAR